MRPEKTFIPLKRKWFQSRGKWPLPREKCSASARLLQRPPTALILTILILMVVLCCASCATTKKTQKEQTQTEQVKATSDTAASVIRTIQKEVVPSSKAEIAIPVDNLLKLPGQAVYTRHSGQATATVAKKGEVIYVAATCDSLQREVEYYEELYYKARDALEQYKDNIQTESKQQSSNLTAKLIKLFWMGFAAGALTTIFIIIFKRHGK